MKEGTLESLPRWVPKLRRQVKLQMANLRHCKNISQREMTHHFRVAVVNASRLQRKVKINMEGIMVMFLLILLLIITRIIK
jgi:hypothetical protein